MTTAIEPEIVNSITIGAEPILPRELLPTFDFDSPKVAGRLPFLRPCHSDCGARPGTAGVVQGQHWFLSQGFPAVVTYDCRAEAIPKEALADEFVFVIREAALRGLPVVVDARRSDAEVARRLERVVPQISSSL